MVVNWFVTRRWGILQGPRPTKTQTSPKIVFFPTKRHRGVQTTNVTEIVVHRALVFVVQIKRHVFTVHVQSTPNAVPVLPFCTVRFFAFGVPDFFSFPVHPPGMRAIPHSSPGTLPSRKRLVGPSNLWAGVFGDLPSFVGGGIVVGIVHFVVFGVNHFKFIIPFASVQRNAFRGPCGEIFGRGAIKGSTCAFLVQHGQRFKRGLSGLVFG